MSDAPKFTSIGGQAVIEGVMMRSPRYIAVAVRKPDQKIALRIAPYRSWASRYPLLKKPVLRGVATLLESMIQGIDALSFSASLSADPADAADERAPARNPGEGLSSWAIAGSIITALLLGMGLFVALPHALTVLFANSSAAGSGTITAQSPLFHLIDGLLKMSILLAYVYLIALMKDIHRVFQYHGAEHKSIYTFEAGEELTVENARKHITLHPRCGTSFLLFLVLISVGVFSIVFPLLGLATLTSNAVLNHVLMVGLKIVLMLPVAGLAYEFIKLCACRMDSPFFRAMIWPGMILQKLTTREPDDEQLEVALASLRQALRMEKGLPALAEIRGLSELGMVHATVAEFAE